MTREEFEKRAGKVSDRDFEVVEFVYNFHPSISETKGKDQIAEIWKIGGMRIIADMLPTARRAEHLERSIRSTRRELEILISEYSLLEQGVNKSLDTQPQQ